VAGGIGISPLFSVFRHFERSRLQAQGGRRCGGLQEVVLVFGARCRAELAFEDEIRAVARRYPSDVAVRFVVPDPPARGGEGHFSAGDALTEGHIASALGARRGGSLCLLCGPPPMIEAAETHCIALGIPPAAVVYEKWW
jgi:ferredoxin-NADP reductase